MGVALKPVHGLIIVQILTYKKGVASIYWYTPKYDFKVGVAHEEHAFALFHLHIVCCLQFSVTCEGLTQINFKAGLTQMTRITRPSFNAVCVSHLLRLH